MSERHLVVNGKDRTSAAESVRALLIELGFGSDPKGVAVAIDGAVVPRSRWDQTTPQVGASVDIVGAVQGG